MGKNIRRQFIKKIDQIMDLKHMKKGSTLLITREMQIKTTLRHHFSLVRLAKNQKLTITLCWQGCGGTQALSYIASSLGMQNGITPMERNLAKQNFPTNFICIYTSTCQSHFWALTLKIQLQ